MSIIEQHRTGPASDPEPATPSDDIIRLAQSLREALRQKLLDRPQPAPNPYWAVGAD